MKEALVEELLYLCSFLLCSVLCQSVIC